MYVAILGRYKACLLLLIRRIKFDATHDSYSRHGNSVLIIIINVIRCFASQCIALRGSSNVILVKDNENFWKLVETLPKFDKTLADHLAHTTKNNSTSSLFM